jgi:uncharacterized protein YejL (UPF0352 family)
MPEHVEAVINEMADILSRKAAAPPKKYISLRQYV